jgi:hypothetical protein
MRARETHTRQHLPTPASSRVRIYKPGYMVTSLQPFQRKGSGVTGPVTKTGRPLQPLHWNGSRVTGPFTWPAGGHHTPGPHTPGPCRCCPAPAPGPYPAQCRPGTGLRHAAGDRRCCAGGPCLRVDQTFFGKSRGWTFRISPQLRSPDLHPPPPSPRCTRNP